MANPKTVLLLAFLCFLAATAFILPAFAQTVSQPSAQVNSTNESFNQTANSTNETNATNESAVAAQTVMATGTTDKGQPENAGDAGILGISSAPNTNELSTARNTGDSGESQSSGADNQPWPGDIGTLTAVVVGVLLLAVILKIVTSQLARQEQIEIHRMLGSESRADILTILSEGEKNLTYISNELGKSKATTVEHLEKLVSARLVEKDASPERKFVFYRLTSQGRTALRDGMKLQERP